jgi:dTDP-4-amino-4,6-dideoxygalactose transaminase
MMYDQHLLKPGAEVFERWKYVTPNFSMRMSNLAASLLRPQIGQLASRGQRWNHVYATLARELGKAAHLTVPPRHPKEDFIASSIQFTLDFTPAQIERFLKECTLRGLYIKWFGTPTPVAFTSNYEHWHYIDQKPDLQKSKAVLKQLCDLRTPVSLTDDDCVLIGRIVATACALAAGH